MPRTSRRAPRRRIPNTGFTVSVNRGRRAGPRRRAPRARNARGGPRIPRGLAPLTVPMKIGYTYDVLGTGAAVVNFDADVGMPFAPPAWFTRYEPIFDQVRINKCHIEITCPYNIGQHNVGTQSLYQLWYKKAFGTAEVPPGSITEWLNMQSAKRAIFSGRKNAVDLYFTPAFESRQQPLNAANTSLKLLYKEWATIQTTPGAMTPHIGMIGQIQRLDGSVIGNTNVFKVNVTLYAEVRGIKQL